jgi:hypothetical protein
VNGIGLGLLLTPLNQENSREYEKSAGQGRKPNIAEVVAEQNEERHQTEAKPPRDAAQHFGETHDQLLIVNDFKMAVGTSIWL